MTFVKIFSIIEKENFKQKLQKIARLESGCQSSNELNKKPEDGNETETKINKKRNCKRIVKRKVTCKIVTTSKNSYILKKFTNKKSIVTCKQEPTER